MKKKLLFSIIISLILLVSCKKEQSNREDNISESEMAFNIEIQTLSKKGYKIQDTINNIYILKLNDTISFINKSKYSSLDTIKTLNNTYSSIKNLKGISTTSTPGAGGPSYIFRVIAGYCIMSGVMEQVAPGVVDDLGEAFDSHDIAININAFQRIDMVGEDGGAIIFKSEGQYSRNLWASPEGEATITTYYDEEAVYLLNKAAEVCPTGELIALL